MRSSLRSRRRNERNLWTFSRHLTALGCLLCATVAFADLRSHRLVDVLSAYEAAGFSFVYSNGLIRRDLEVRIDLDSVLSTQRLELALQQIGFALEGSEIDPGP